MNKMNTRGTSLSTEGRKTSIRRFVETARRITVSEIASEFHISESTVRRDIVDLSRRGEIVRFHGGAAAIGDAPVEQPTLRRAKEQTEEKRAIGELAATLVNEGETIFLGSGSTVLEVAKSLRNCPNLTIITNSLVVINVLFDAPNVTIICPGGLLRAGELSMIGHICERSLQELRADKVIMGIHAIDLENGLTSDHLPEILTDRSILQIASKVILVADHTKLGKVSPIVVGPVTTIHTLVTDRLASLDFVEKLRLRGINVLFA